MKALSDSNHQSSEREERLSSQMAHLQEEVHAWKDRYMKTKAQQRNMHASTNGITIEPPSARKAASEGAFSSATGLVKDVHVTKFQIAIDELLHVARTGDPSSVLDQMKPVVVSVRHITRDAGESSGGKTDATGLRSKLTMRVAATANNLITASKNFSAANGLSPVSLLDAAASHLAAAVVELIRTVKVRPTPPGELDIEDDDRAAASVGASRSYPARNGIAREVESVYSTNSAATLRSLNQDASAMTLASSRHDVPDGKAQPPLPGAANGSRIQDEDVEELKVSPIT